MRTHPLERDGSNVQPKAGIAIDKSEIPENPAERRRHPRIDAFRLVAYYGKRNGRKASTARMGRTLNISKGGIRLEAQEDLSEGSILQLLIFCGDTTFSIEGKVVNRKKSSKGTYSLGIAFTKDQEELIEKAT